MSEETAGVSQFTNEVLIADLLVRLSSIETLLVMKGVCTQEELKSLTSLFADSITQHILNKAGISENLKEFIASLRGEKG
jgi:hypothetical protein